MEIKENISLAPLTTFGVGGPARYFVTATSEEDILEALEFADQKNRPVFVLGGGSNILVDDKGFDGLVIKNELMGFEMTPRGDSANVSVGAGENWDETVKKCIENGWAGIECLSGIPGSVGAAPVQNIGAYGASVDKVIEEVRAIDAKTGDVIFFDNDRCEFSYRDSVFKRNPGRHIITKVTFALTGNFLPNLTYHDLKEYFAGKIDPTLAEIRQAILEIRSRKGMVIMPKYESYQSVGSFFKNPIVGRAEFENAKKKVEREKEKDGLVSHHNAVVVSGCRDPWFWELSGGRVKISAACLIERAGFSKGYREGEAGISPKHPLAIINCGKAKAAELFNLARKIQDSVREKFGVSIEAEAQLVGFENNPLDFACALTE